MPLTLRVHGSRRQVSKAGNPLDEVRQQRNKCIALCLLFLLLPLLSLPSTRFPELACFAHQGFVFGLRDSQALGTVISSGENATHKFDSVQMAAATHTVVCQKQKVRLP